VIQSNFTSRSGLIAQQQRMDVIANNIANLNTTGYKSVRADFKDALYQTLLRPVQPQDDVDLERGHGVLLGATTTSLHAGTATYTDRPLDMMLVGDGYFRVQDVNSNEVLYTRDGAFRISAEADGKYLVTADGYYVLSNTGNRINIGELNDSDIAVNNEGMLYESSTNTFIAQLGISTFVNRQGLELASGNRYRETAASGAPIASTAEVEQSMLESSNVDLATEITRMIRAQRAFSLASTAVRTADDMDAKANALRT